MPRFLYPGKSALKPHGRVQLSTILPPNGFDRGWCTQSRLSSGRRRKGKLFRRLELWVSRDSRGPGSSPDTVALPQGPPECQRVSSAIGGATGGGEGGQSVGTGRCAYIRSTVAANVGLTWESTTHRPHGVGSST